MDPSSPLLQSWPGPHGGAPPWNLVRSEDFVGAFEAAIETTEQEIDAIATNPEPPTFENTIKALEKSGRALNRLQSARTTRLVRRRLSSLGTRNVVTVRD